MPNLVLIANPSASGFTGAAFRDVVAILRERYDVDTLWPGDAVASRRAAADAAAEGVDVVVAMGGDGVVHHVANGLIGTATSLGILPAGTTNVLARIHGMPISPTKAAHSLLDASPQLVPAAHFATELADGVGSGHALFSLGAGFDADVVAVAERRPHAKLYFGSIHYARTALTRILGPYRSRQAHVSVQCAGERIDAVTVFVQVHGLYTYFGPAPLRLGTDSPGGLTVLALENVTPLTAADVVARLASRRSLAGARGAHLWTDVEKLIIEADPPVTLQADGELLGPIYDLEISPVPFALNVLTAG